MNDKLWCGTILVSVALLSAAIVSGSCAVATEPFGLNAVNSERFMSMSTLVGIIGVALIGFGLFSKSEPRT